MYMFDGKSFDSSAKGHFCSVMFNNKVYFPIVDYDFSVYVAVANYLADVYHIDLAFIYPDYECETHRLVDPDFWHDGILQFVKCVYSGCYAGVVLCLDYISKNLWAWTASCHQFAFRIIEISGDSAMMALYMDFCHKNGIGQSDLVL